MKTMPTAFLITGLADSPMVELATEWGWSVEMKVQDDLIFVTPDEEVVRVTRSASRVSHLRSGSKIYLGPSHQECHGVEDLIIRIGSGDLAIAIPPG